MKKLVKTALLDSDEWHLFWADENGECVKDIDWPDHWPTDFVSWEFVQSEGFEVEYI